MSSKTKTAGNQDAKPALTPNLRFPEFRDAGAWTSKPMSKIYSFKGNNSLSRDKLNYERGTVKNIHYGDIHTKFATHFDITKELVPFINPSESLASFKADNFCVEGDMIFADASEDLADIGKAIEIVRLNRERVVSGLHTILARQNEDELFLGFGGHLFKSKWVRTQIQKESQGSKVLGLSGGRLAKIEVPFPSLAEQQKIAECLTTLDEVIAAQSQKIAELKTHKKGLMQQLFPREGETLPRLRFPEFQDAPEWVVTTIGNLKPFVTSGSRGWAAFYADHGELFVRMTNLWRDSIYLDLTDSKFVQLPPGANEGVRTQLKEHDVLISITADIGIIGYVDASVPSPAYINQHIALVRFDAAKLHGKYVAYFLASDKSQRLFRASTDTGTKAGMSLIGIQKIEIMLPSLPEQQRIADCLTSLDDLIAAQSAKLSALKTHKRGLMQQLFPSPEDE